MLGSEANFPMCTGTVDNKSLCSPKGLVEGHAYTFVY